MQSAIGDYDWLVQPEGLLPQYRDALAISCRRLRETHLKLALLLATCPTGARASQALGQYGFLDRDVEISLAAVSTEDFPALAMVARGLKELEARRTLG